MKFLDVNVSFFIPIWRRIAVVTLCLGWALVEFSSGTPFWGILFGALGLYSGWVFFFDFNPPMPEQKKDDVSQDDE
ncbi:MAG TPA: hypothetical protein VLA51_06520 [Paracoccaceae bacterium]|nr:hypothetical protein [Paracoccaceae bacterium]